MSERDRSVERERDRLRQRGRERRNEKGVRVVGGGSKRQSEVGEKRAEDSCKELIGSGGRGSLLSVKWLVSWEGLGICTFGKVWGYVS